MKIIKAVSILSLAGVAVLMSSFQAQAGPTGTKTTRPMPPIEKKHKMLSLEVRNTSDDPVRVKLYVNDAEHGLLLAPRETVRHAVLMKVSEEKLLIRVLASALKEKETGKCEAVIKLGKTDPKVGILIRDVRKGLFCEIEEKGGQEKGSLLDPKVSTKK